MSASTTLTLAGQLTAALATERDPWHRTLSLISAIELMAEAFHGHDEHNALMDFASELRGQLFQNAQAVLDRNEDEREADRFGGFVDVMRLWNETERKRHEALVRNRFIKPSVYQPIESPVLA